MSGCLLPYDREALRSQWRAASPFPFFRIENFIAPEFLKSVVGAYPTYEQARVLGGQEFDAVNEKLKIQVTDSGKFPAPVKQLADVLSSPEFLSDLEFITGIPKLQADPTYGGGGMHLTNKSGRLDVHVDFNFHDQIQLFRRLNILIYLNPVWEDSWGGKIELWDKEVTTCVHSLSPILNRCVVFETSDISWHGVTPLHCPQEMTRKSFAAYYYTREAPAGWDGVKHSTIFRPRPTEAFRGAVLMPAEQMKRNAGKFLVSAKQAVRKFLG
jgi:Rps23 Pro-64 3,4-dihydroxylase Tpa1-like proline 4-hydroxylase